MRTFEYIERSESIFTTEIVNLVSMIHEHKGKQELFLESSTDVLSTLLKVAMIQSTKSSNRIEGIVASDQRLAKLVNMDTTPANRSEAEIAGYQKALSTIHESHEYIGISSSYILQLHQILYSYTLETGGHFKNTDNIIEEINAKGESSIRFVPVPAFQTSEAMRNMCEAFEKAWNTPRVDHLRIIPLFILDFLSIHPFNDGNGRMSRLLTLLLLYHAGYIVGKYISLEHIIEETKESYYSTLKKSSIGWHENANSDIEFSEYLLGIILNAYKEFESRVKLSQDRSLSKPERILEILKTTLEPISKRELLTRLPDVSTTTVERTLASLLQSGELVKVGKGRGTKYVLNRNE